MELLQRQAQRKVDKIQTIKDQFPAPMGWIRYIRDALLMRGGQLAAKAGCAPSSISELEKRERLGTITIKKLREIGDAMDCDLVYALVPRRPISEVIDNAAQKKAEGVIGRADVHMSLDDQSVRSPYDERIEALKMQLIEKRDVW